MSFKYMKEFIDATDGRGGLHFEIESEAISKVLSQFNLENIPDPDMDFPGFGWADQWFAVEDEQIIGIPKDMGSLKRWICAFFEMYGGYPLADMMDPTGLPTLTDDTRTKIAKAIESNIDEIVSDMTWCKIVSIEASHEYGWEGQKTVYEDGDFDMAECISGAVLGDIVISLERAKEQAKEVGNGFLREIAFLTVHSTLHLLGYDHERSKEEDELQCRLQREIVENIEKRLA